MNDDQALALAASKDFVWHQRWRLTDTVAAPGTNDIEHLLDVTGVPQRLDGLSVLDIGTTNGGAAFIAERRGAEHVVAVDLYPPSWFGFDMIADALGSQVEFVQASVYDLPARLDTQFDLVLFYGVLYHLRHPLLALDSLHQLTRQRLFVETAVSPRPDNVVEFYPDEYLGDSSNWFVPSVTTIRDWFRSSGWQLDNESSWPDGTPSRCAFACAPAEPSYPSVSYEVPLRVNVQHADKVYGEP